MRALVTGGAGFIGSHLVDRLLSDGFDVRILDSLEPRVHPKGKPAWVAKEAEFIHGDVRDRDTLSKALRGVHLVFHEAAYQDYMTDFSRFFQVNAASTAMIHEILAGSARSGKSRTIEKVIVASSQAVYGEGQYRCMNASCSESSKVVQPEARSDGQLREGKWDVLCPACGLPMENLLLAEEFHNPFNAYAISKLSQELAALRLGRLFGIPTVALRYSIVQGPRQSLYNQYSGICRIFCLRLMNGSPPVIYEDGRQKRDYTHIDDVVEANITVMADGRADYRVFNVGSGTEVTVGQYAETLAGKLGKNIEPIIPGNYRVGDNRHSVSDISKLLSLGWKPKKNLHDILDDYIAWARQQADLGDYFRAANRAMEGAGVMRRAGAPR